MMRLLQHPRTLLVARMFGYSLFFLIAMLVALPLTFPTRQLRSFLAQKARSQGYPLEIENLAMRGLGGIEFDGIHLTLPGKEGEPGENGSVGPALPEADLKIDKLTARIALLPAIFGKTVDVTFEVDAGGGHLEGGHFVQKGENLDLEIAKIDALGLGEIGIGRRILSDVSGRKFSGELLAGLGGSAKVHWGGSTDDLSGAVDLELADAMLKQPELNLQGGLRLTDLGVGTLTLKVRIGLKSTLAALANVRGADKATMVHIEKMEATGSDLDLTTDETSHILIPPGKGGWKAATIQLHFSLSISDKSSKAKKAKEGDKKSEKAAKEGDDKGTDNKDGDKKEGETDRAKWTQLLTMFGPQLKPFERNGFIGIGCIGPLARPQCKPELPVVTTGVRGPGEGGPLLGKPDDKKAGPGAPTPQIPEVAPQQPVMPPAPVKFEPVQRPEPPPPAVIQPAPAPEPPKVEPPKPEAAKPENGAGNQGAGGDSPRRGRGNRDEADNPRGNGRDDGDDEPKPKRKGKADEGDEGDDRGGEGKPAPEGDGE